MSGLKEQHLVTFLRMIRHRLGGAGVLAEFAGVGRCHLSSMLHGDDARGIHTWGKIRRHVTAVEWSFLEQCTAWNNFAARYPGFANRALRVPVCDNPENPLMPVVCCVCYKALKSKKCEPASAGQVSSGLCAEHFAERMRKQGATDAVIARHLADDDAIDRADATVVPLGETGLRQPQLFLS